MCLVVCFNICINYYRIELVMRYCPLDKLFIILISALLGIGTPLYLSAGKWKQRDEIDLSYLSSCMYILSLEYLLLSRCICVGIIILMATECQALLTLREQLKRFIDLTANVPYYLIVLYFICRYIYLSVDFDSSTSWRNYTAGWYHMYAEELPGYGLCLRGSFCYTVECTKEESAS